MATPPPPVRDDPPAAPPRMTESEFVAWCGGFEHARAEWVDGEVVVMSPANRGHVRLNSLLNAVLFSYVEARALGEILGPEFVARFHAEGGLRRLVPDLLFVANERRHLIGPTYLDGVPDLAVEIVSPDSTSRDYQEKYRDYESGGVREYWIIDPLACAFEAYGLDGGRFVRIAEADGRVDSAVLPGFFLRPDWLWREPLPRLADVLRELGA